jgi:hypothetical protein
MTEDDDAQSGATMKTQDEKTQPNIALVLTVELRPPAAHRGVRLDCARQVSVQPTGYLARGAPEAIS